MTSTALTQPQLSNFEFRNHRRRRISFRYLSVIPDGPDSLRRKIPSRRAHSPARLPLKSESAIAEPSTFKVTFLHRNAYRY